MYGRGYFSSLLTMISSLFGSCAALAAAAGRKNNIKANVMAVRKFMFNRILQDGIDKTVRVENILYLS